MTHLGPLLILTGLALNGAGAITVALPDFPQLRSYHSAGRLRKGLNVYEHSALTREHVGFKEVMNKIESMAGGRPPHRFEALIWVTPRMSTGGPFSGREREVAFRMEEGENEIWGDLDFDDFRRATEREIRKKEAHIRALGFLSWGVGFILQVFGHFLQNPTLVEMLS